MLTAPALLGLLELTPGSAGEPVPTMPGIDMGRYALVCGGLVAAILALAWAFKRFLAGNMTLRAGQRAMKVVDVLPLGGKRQLAVVRCYDRSFLIGMGEREVNLVTELDAEEDLEGQLLASKPSEGRSFKSLFQRAVREAPPGVAAAAVPQPEPRAAQAEPPPRASTPSMDPHGLGPGVLG